MKKPLRVNGNERERRRRRRRRSEDEEGALPRESVRP